jgi:ATP-dependent Clp protease ATP-binding subunit ClpC
MLSVEPSLPSGLHVAPLEGAACRPERWARSAFGPQHGTPPWYHGGVFERFGGGRRVVVLAEEQARLLEHGYVGTEHLLLGVIAAGGPVSDALVRRGAALEAVQDEVVAIVGVVEGRPRGRIPFTPRAKSVLELSLREALRLGQRSIGSAHVLLGLLREGQGIACQALVLLDVDLGQLRDEAEEIATQP